MNGNNASNALELRNVCKYASLIRSYSASGARSPDEIEPGATAAFNTV